MVVAHRPDKKSPPSTTDQVAMKRALRRKGLNRDGQASGLAVQFGLVNNHLAAYGLLAKGHPEPIYTRRKVISTQRPGALVA